MRVRCVGCEVRSAKVITAGMLLAGKSPQEICDYLSDSFGVNYYVQAGVTGVGVSTRPAIVRDNSASPMNPYHIWVLSK